MIISLKKYIGTICPKCGKINVTKITPFLLNDELCRRCPGCNTQYLRVFKRRDKEYALELSCYICHDTHKYYLSFGRMWKSTLTKFNCNYAREDAIYIGDKEEVLNSCNALAMRLQKLIEGSCREPSSRLHPLIQQAIFDINDKINRGNIICLCGDCRLVVEAERTGIVIYCNNCFSMECIPIRTKDDITKLKNRSVILLTNGNKE